MRHVQPEALRARQLRCAADVGCMSQQPTAAALQGDFAAAAIIRAPPEQVTEAVPRALSTTIQVAVARRCRRGDVVRVTLPQGALRDSAGAALTPPVSAVSTCHGDSLQDVRGVHRALTAVGAVFALAVVVGAVVTVVLLWRAVKEGEGHYGALQVGGATLGLLLLGAPPWTHQNVTILCVLSCTDEMLLYFC